MNSISPVLQFSIILYVMCTTKLDTQQRCVSLTIEIMSDLFKYITHQLLYVWIWVYIFAITLPWVAKNKNVPLFLCLQKFRFVDDTVLLSPFIFILLNFELLSDLSVLNYLILIWIFTPEQAKATRILWPYYRCHTVWHVALTLVINLFRSSPVN